MKLPRRGEKGFTLVELLIVLAILAVLAAVVIPNVTGMFGRGAKQSFSTDQKTIQTAVAAFYFDVHRYDGTDFWEGAIAGHYYPTENAAASELGVSTTPTDADTTGFTQETFAVTGLTAGSEDDEIADAAIWMGLLTNIPGSFAGHAPDTVAPQADEDGPYVNEFPESSTDINGNPKTTTGTYTWIILENGQIVGVSKAPKAPYGWYAGFNGTYP